MSDTEGVTVSQQAPEPVGAYPHARRAGGLLFLSGIGPRRRGRREIPGVTLDAAGRVVAHDIELQCRAVFDNVRLVLEEAGSGWDRLIDVTVFLTDIERDFAVYNRVYAEYFGEIRPCRTTVEVNRLPTPIAIELKCIATIDSRAPHPTLSGGRGRKDSNAMQTPTPPIDFKRWIYTHRAVLRPPVCNKQVFPEGELLVMVVGGPNHRKDYHVDAGPEFFYQIEGDMLLKTIQDGQVVDVPIRAGEVFLLPPLVPHSPQRYADTIGLVIERKRLPHERDGFQWYCDGCHHLLYEEFIELRDIEKDLPPVFARFFASPDTVCRRCGTVMPAPAGGG